MRLISKTNSVTAKVDLYLTVWQVLKKSVRGNILGVNVLNKTKNLSSLEK